MRQNRSPCNPSRCPTRHHAGIECRARRSGEESGESAIGVRRSRPTGTTGKRNGFASLESLADERECSAEGGIERSAIDERSSEVLISDRGVPASLRSSTLVPLILPNVVGVVVGVGLGPPGLGVGTTLFSAL